MQTVFSHIIRSRLSAEYENVATDALAFILDTSAAARRGMMVLLRGIAPDLPDLRFRTQQTEGNARPDMWGMDLATPRALIENKFWAGLTANQPLEYLRILAGKGESGLVLFVVPFERLETVWNELARRVADGGVAAEPAAVTLSGCRALRVDIEGGAETLLGIASWDRLLASIDSETAEDSDAQANLVQLRALCRAADEGALSPFAAEDLTDQRIPATLLHLNAVVRDAIQRGVAEGALAIEGLRETYSATASGRYVWIPAREGAGGRLATDLERWRTPGTTPLWLSFPASEFGRAQEVRPVLEPWCETEGLPHTATDGEFAVGITVPAGEEHDTVVNSVVDQIARVSDRLRGLSPRRMPGEP